MLEAKSAERKTALPDQEDRLETGAVRFSLRALPTLPAPLTTDGGFPLPLALGTGLLVVPALAQFGIETGALHLPLEAAQRAVETLVVLNDDFQDDHAPDWMVPTVEQKKLNARRSHGNGPRQPSLQGRRPSRWSVCV